MVNEGLAMSGILLDWTQKAISWFNFAVRVFGL